jgi:hypothetical protein
MAPPAVIVTSQGVAAANINSAGSHSRACPCVRLAQACKSHGAGAAQGAGEEEGLLSGSGIPSKFELRFLPPLQPGAMATHISEVFKIHSSLPKLCELLDRTVIPLLDVVAFVAARNRRGAGGGTMVFAVPESHTRCKLVLGAKEALFIRCGPPCSSCCALLRVDACECEVDACECECMRCWRLRQPTRASWVSPHLAVTATAPLLCTD